MILFKKNSFFNIFLCFQLYNFPIENFAKLINDIANKAMDAEKTAVVKTLSDVDFHHIGTPSSAYWKLK